MGLKVISVPVGMHPRDLRQHEICKIVNPSQKEEIVAVKVGTKLIALNVSGIYWSDVEQTPSLLVERLVPGTTIVVTPYEAHM